MRKLYEDFFDDNAGQLQTSLKGLTDEIDNPVDDYDYVVDFYDSSPDEAEKMKDKLETILSACVAEFSEIEVNEEGHVRFGFNNSITNLKLFCRFINSLDKFKSVYAIYDKDGEPVLEQDMFDGPTEWTHKKIHFAYQFFPFEKYGFKPFDLFVTDNVYDRLFNIANVEEVCLAERYVGTVDLNFLKNEPDNAEGYYIVAYEFNSIPVPPNLKLDIINGASGYSFRDKDWKFTNPYYQFGYDMSGDFYFSFDMLVGPVYIEAIDNAIELVISCTMYEDDGGEDSFKATLPDFMEHVNKIFGGHMPETLREGIESEVRRREANRFDED
jgi:hypothetical protein